MFWKPFRIISGFHNLLFYNAFGLTSLLKLKSTSLNINVDNLLLQSWGWNLVDNHLLHNGDSQGNYPQLNNAPKYQVLPYPYSL